MPETQTEPTSKPITIEDVHKIIGAMFLELEMLRRENTSLKQRLSNGNP